MRRHELIVAAIFLLFAALAGSAWLRDDIAHLTLFGLGALAFLLRLIGSYRERAQATE